ncbi:MAG TPA: ABC transporter permease [Candidatus Sulfomarinibacteraceae bacterium]|nr:ABC transporter permease [Candidatus Sulfomarinibacteraceae bacterium]
MELSPLTGLCGGSLLIVFLFVVYAFLRGSTGLRAYIVTRLVLTLPMVFILVSLIFFVLRIIPGDPVTSQLGPRGGAEVRERMTRELGLDRPLLIQYVDYLRSAATFDLGNSLIFGNRPVIDELSERLPATVELVVPSMLFATGFGILGGAYAAKHRKTKTDYGLRLFSITAYSIPVFWLGLIFQVVFALRLAILPVAGRIDPIVSIGLERRTNMLIIDSILAGNMPALQSAALHLILPALSLGLILSGVFLRLSRINVVEALVEDYITAGRARGIRENVLVFGHALGNAMIPIVTLIGLQVSVLLAGAVLTETTFSWPGMGLYLVERIGQRDYTAVQGVIIIFAMSVAIISLLTDIIYAFLDPRVRY